MFLRKNTVRNTLKKMNEKGQFYSTEFIFSLIIFLGVLVMILYFFNNTNQKMNLDKQANDDFFQANYALEQILFTNGNPSNWQTHLDINNIYSIGLANARNELDYNKISRLADFNIYYYDVLYLMGLGDKNVYLAIYEAGKNKPIKEFGVVPNKADTITNIRRFAELNKKVVYVDAKVWQ